MRTASTLLALFLAAHAFAASPELTLGAEHSIAGRQRGGAAAANARGTLVSWSDGVETKVAFLSALDRPVTLPHWTTGAATETAPAAAAAPDAWLVVWSESTTMTVTYLAARIAPDLSVLDQPPILVRTLQRGAVTVMPRVVWNGADWLVATDTTVSRVGRDGLLREQITMSGPGIVAASEAAALAASVEQRDFAFCSGFTMPLCRPATFVLSGRILGGLGVMQNALPLTNPTGFRSLLGAAGAEEGFLVVSVSGATAGASAITATPVTGSGTALQEQTLDGLGDHTFAGAAVAADGDGGYVVAWTSAAGNGARLRVSHVDAQGFRTGETLTIGGVNEAEGPLSLVRIHAHRYALVYPQTFSTLTPRLVIRELDLATTRGRSVRH